MWPAAATAFCHHDADDSAAAFAFALTAATTSASIASASATVIDAVEPPTPFFGDYSCRITTREKAAKKRRQVTVKLGGA